MSDWEKKIWNTLIKVHGCKPDKEDCKFQHCNHWASCERLYESIRTLLEEYVTVEFHEKHLEENKEYYEKLLEEQKNNILSTIKIDIPLEDKIKSQCADELEKVQKAGFGSGTVINRCLDIDYLIKKWRGK